jgi:hypothetical protein
MELPDRTSSFYTNWRPSLSVADKKRAFVSMPFGNFPRILVLVKKSAAVDPRASA